MGLPVHPAAPAGHGAPPARAPANVADFRTWRVARDMVARHGALAPLHARDRAAAAACDGDGDAARLWHVIADTSGRLLRAAR